MIRKLILSSLLFVFISSSANAQWSTFVAQSLRRHYPIPQRCEPCRTLTYHECESHMKEVVHFIESHNLKKHPSPNMRDCELRAEALRLSFCKKFDPDTVDLWKEYIDWRTAPVFKRQYKEKMYYWNYHS